MTTHAPTFFFYDYESFGINPAKDRPAQFAGIRTDENFNIIGEPVMLFCQQTNDYLPSPEAIMVTGILPQQCQQQGVPEYQFAEGILGEFSQPNTCILGYNNVRFDDEMTRYTFYRNLIAPYAYSYANGNSRWDLIDLVRACYALRPDGINWVYDDDGLPSFRLEQLTKANGIAHENAHDAMSDVYATIALMKLIKEKQPKLFSYFFQRRHKKAIAEMLDFSNLTPLVHVSGMFGNARSNISVIVPVVWDATNSNKALCIDLMGDIDAMLNRTPEKNHELLFTPKAELELQNIAPVPLKGVHVNKCPILAPLNVLRPQDAERLGIDLNRCLANLEKLKQHLSLRDDVLTIQGDQQFTDTSAVENVETQLYNGFFSYADQDHLTLLRETPVADWDKLNLKFSDPRIPALLFHYKARYFYKTLSRAEQLKWQKYRRAKIDAEIPAFEESFQQMCEQHSTDKQKLQLLQKLAEYAKKIVA